MFIELTSVFGFKKILVNLNNVLHIYDMENGCRVLYVDTDVEVVESYEKVKQLISEEIAAERGY